MTAHRGGFFVSGGNGKNDFFKKGTEIEAIRLAKLLRNDGMSFPKIAAALEQQGYVPRNKGAWHPQTVKNMITGAA